MVMKCVLRGALDELPDPRVNVAPWIAFWTKWTGSWQTLVRKFVRLAGETPSLAYEALGMVGVDVAWLVADADDEERWCTECWKEFKSVAAVRCHKIRVHGLRNPLAQKFVGSTCTQCDVQFHLRDRLMMHLRGSACGDAMLWAPDVFPEVIAEENKKARETIKANRKLGLHDWAGPSARGGKARPD